MSDTDPLCETCYLPRSWHHGPKCGCWVNLRHTFQGPGIVPADRRPRGLPILPPLPQEPADLNAGVGGKDAW